MKKVILVISSAVLTLLCLELTLRVFPVKLGFQKDQLWDHINGNGEEGVKEFTSVYTFDSEIGYVRPAALEELKKMSNSEHPRLLFLGDSVTELGQYPQQIQALFASQSPQQAVEVFNVGTIGYGTKMEKDFYLKYAEEAKPDLVVLQMHPNDVGGTPVILPTEDSWIAFSPRYSRAFEQLPFLKKSHLYQLLVILFLQNSGDAYSADKYRQEMLTALTVLNQQLQKENIPLLIFIQPAYYTFDPGDYTYSNVKRVVVDAGLEKDLVEMESEFDAHGKEALMSNVDHPNQAGEELIAKTLYTRIEQLLDR